VCLCAHVKSERVNIQSCLDTGLNFSYSPGTFSFLFMQSIPGDCCNFSKWAINTLQPIGIAGDRLRVYTVRWGEEYI
jgi:hypothetical protein